MTKNVMIWTGLLVGVVIGLLTFGWVDRAQRREAQRRLVQTEKESCKEAMAKIGAVPLNLNLSYGYLVNIFGPPRISGKTFTKNEVTVSWWNDTVWAQFVTEEREPSYSAQPIRLHVRAPFKGSLQGINLGDSPENLPSNLRLSWDKLMEYERSLGGRGGKGVDPNRPRRLTISGDPISIEYMVKDGKISSIRAWDKRWLTVPADMRKGASKF